MSRRRYSKNEFGPKVRRSDEQLDELFRARLRNVGDLCRLFDDGNSGIAAPLSTEIINAMTSGAGPKNRTAFRYPIFSSAPHDRSNLIASNKLISCTVDGDPIVADYLPFFQMFDRPPEKWVPFNEWWNEVIFIGGAAKIGLDPSMVPLRVEDQVPFEKRIRFTRFTFIRLVRDTTGSHTDAEIPTVLDDLNKSIGFGAHIQIEMPNGTLVRTDDGSLKVRTAPTQGMVRQVAEELLIACGAIR